MYLIYFDRLKIWGYSLFNFFIIDAEEEFSSHAVGIFQMKFIISSVIILTTVAKFS